MARLPWIIGLVPVLAAPTCFDNGADDVSYGVDLRVVPDRLTYTIGDVVTITAGVDPRDRLHAWRYAWSVSDSEAREITLELTQATTVVVEVFDDLNPRADGAPRGTARRDLWVGLDLRIVRDPDRDVYQVGEAVRLTAEARGHPGPFVYDWRRIPGSIAANDQPSLTLDLSVAETFAVTVEAEPEEWWTSGVAQTEIVVGPAQSECGEPFDVALELSRPDGRCVYTDSIGGVSYRGFDVDDADVGLSLTASHPTTLLEWDLAVQDLTAPAYAPDTRVTQDVVLGFPGVTYAAAVRATDGCEPARVAEDLVLLYLDDGICD